MPKVAENEFSTRIMLQLMALRAAGGLPWRESAPGRGIYRWEFRAAGWPISVDVDANVLELRVYHGRDEVCMARLPEPAMAAILGRGPVPPGTPGDATAARAELRRIVADWKANNARIFIQPPAQVGHPDHWNRA